VAVHLDRDFRCRLPLSGRAISRTLPVVVNAAGALAEKLGLPKLNFQVLRRTIATLAQTKGGVKDIQTILGHSNPDLTASCYMQPIAESVKQTQEAIYQELTAPQNGTRGVKKTKNLVRFGTVGVVGSPQVIDAERVGA
jgi:integrase